MQKLEFLTLLLQKKKKCALELFGFWPCMERNHFFASCEQRYEQDKDLGEELMPYGHPP